jgi:hypothetical protein
MDALIVASATADRPPLSLPTRRADPTRPLLILLTDLAKPLPWSMAATVCSLNLSPLLFDLSPLIVLYLSGEGSSAMSFGK